MIKSALFDEHLEKILKAKKQLNVCVYTSEPKVESCIQFDKFNYHRLLQINRFMRNVLQFSKQLKAGKVDSISGLPIWVDLERAFEKFRLKLDPRSIQFLQHGIGYVPYDERGFQSSPLSKLFWSSDCARGFELVLSQYSQEKVTNLAPVRAQLDVVMAHIGECYPLYEQSIKSLDRLVNSNCAQLQRYVNGLVRHHKELIVITLKLFVSGEATNSFDAIEKVKKDLPILLRGRAHRDLNSKVSGFIWKIERADKGVCVNLVVFAKPSEVEAPELFRTQIGERWAQLVSSYALGGYSSSWVAGENKIKSYPFTKLQEGAKDWIAPMQEMIFSIALLDLLVRYVGKSEQLENGKENVSSAAKKSDSKAPRSWGKGNLPRTGLTSKARKPVSKTKVKKTLESEKI